MTARKLKKIQATQWLATLGLLAMMGIFIKLAVALTAFTPQTQPVGYTGQEIVTNGTLTSGNESLFRSEYEKEFWSGNLYDYPISAAGDVNIAAERWSGGVAAHLAVQNFDTGRFIGTMKDDGSKIPLRSANLSAAQQSAMVTTVNAASYTSTQITNFLRGDHTNENAAALRQRLTPLGTGTTPTALGDIIHSRPYYLADTTNPTIFVGANDGMLHAFNTATGSERWAYVPSMLLSKMKALAANPYTHDYYVDGQIAVGNATVAGTRILVGALGAGGKGLYALNIDGAAGLTAASDQDAADKILWEITPTTVNYAAPQMYDGSSYVAASGYANLGYTYSAPQIKTINIGGTARQVVLVGNGYNSGGDYQAYLFVINAADGKLIRTIKADNTSTNATGTAVTQGTAASPNGLFNSVAFDSNADGYVDRVYAGDMNGAMWKFDLSSATPSSWTASVLYVTSPKQPITATPAALPHPSGTGYMINFATGGIFSGTQPQALTGATGDLGDTATFYVYGIWDGAPATNTTLVTPALTERCYNTAGTPSALPCPSSETRVRRVSASTPDWATGGNKGWKVALPIGGERVVGEGSFISSGRYYFSTYNPTISYLVPTTTTYVWGENWQMALDSVTGGSVDPFMDLNGDGTITSDDRIKYTATDAAVVGGSQTADTPIITPNVDGISVGKWVARGVESQPTLVKLTALFTTLFNTNPDVTFPPAAPVGTGVAGGHFDEDIYFGAVTQSTQATATITVGSTGSSIPATLGGIQIDGATIVPALTIADITNGTATSTNATVIKNSVTGGNYTATRSGSTVTITAPAGAAYNGKVLTVIAGTSLTPVTAVAAVYASSTITFTNSAAINPTGVNISVNGTNIMTAATPGSAMSSSQLATWVAANSSLAGYTITANGSVVTITANIAVASTYDINSISVTSSSDPTAANYTTVNTSVAGVTAVTAVTGVRASRSFTFTNATAVSLTLFSIKVNGNEILTSTTTGSQSSSGLAAWVASHYSSANYTVSASGSTVTVTANTAATSTYDISSIAVVASGNSAGSITTVNPATNGVTTVIGVTAVAASGSITFTNGSNVSPVGFSIKVNGTEILTSSAPGSKSSSGLATWVKNNSILTGYAITSSGSTVTVTANSAVATTYDISTIVVAETGTAGNFVTVNASVAGVTAVTAVRPTALITFGGAGNATSASIARTLAGSKTITVGGVSASTANPLNIGANKTSVQAAAAVVASIGTAGTIKAYVGGTGTAGGATPTCAAQSTSVVCLVDTGNFTNGSAVATGTTTLGGLTMSTTATAGAVTAVAGANAAGSITFTNGLNISPTSFSIKVNGTEILSSAAPGSLSSSGLATWVSTHLLATFTTNYNVATSSGTVTFTAKTAVASTYNISSIVVTSDALPAGATTSAPSYVSGVTAVTAVTGVKASQSFTFNNSFAMNPTGFSILLNGSEMMGQSTPGSDMSSSQLGAWVAANASRTGYTVTASGSTVTIAAATAIATTYNINSLFISGNVPILPTTTINAATAGVTPVTAVAAVNAVGSFTFTNSSNISLTGFSITVNGTEILSSTAPGSKSSSGLATWVQNNSSLSGYTITKSGSTVTITSNTADTAHDITSIVVTSATMPFIPTTIGASVAGVTVVAAVTGWSNLAAALSTTNFSGGSDGSTAGDTCTSLCTYDTHVHQYDDKYDVTGVNMLNASSISYNLDRAIPSTAQNFKVIMHNQYLNPAVKLHIGNSSYLPSVDFGYISVKNYTTAATLDLATLPTYNRNPASSGDGLTTGAKYIGSLAVNMPIDALTAKNWWGNGDVRVGLIPTTPQCIWNAAGSHDGNMYQPVKVRANDATLGYPLDGPGTLGYTNSTTPATAVGVRHGGALTIQIIRDTTPNSALELNDHLGRPEYGWRVKSALFSTYVLAEYNTYWHHPNELCFNDTGWTKTPYADTAAGSNSTPAAGSTDPKIGSLTGSGGTVSSVVTTGNTTTITYIDGSRDVILRIVNMDGTVTTTTVHIPAGVSGEATAVENEDHSETVTVGSVSATIGAGGTATLSNGATVTTSTTANAAGSTGSGGLLNQNAIGYRRISWKELIRN
jgi:Tfp pilus tip-associated adhesin PilY1